MYRIDRDGWTIRSGDGSRAAHAEHTVAVTEDGPQVLTVPLPLTRRTRLSETPRRFALDIDTDGI
jgi:hypothetical protein